MRKHLPKIVKVTTLLLSTFYFLLSTSFAQSPQKMSYQAVIRDNDNALVKSHAVGMRVSILQGSETGTAVYVETQTPTTNANGLVTIQIGSGTIVTGTFEAIDWSTGTYYIKTETDPLGGTNYTAIVGTSQILSVPYALYAKISGTSSESAGIKQQIMILEDNLIAAGTYKLPDVEGNQYNVVKIGTQTWMAENLKTTKYNDGTAIPNITVDATWTAATTGAYSDYNNTPSNSTTYGRLYNWYAVDNNAGTKVASNGGKNVCPTGWHIPTDAEWTILTDYLTNNGYGYEGSGNDIAKSMASVSGWTTYGTLGTVGNDQVSNNRSGFTALPSGLRGLSGGFYNIGNYDYWWSSTEYSAANAYIRSLNYDYSYVYRYDGDKQYGLSVRCLRDF